MALDDDIRVLSGVALFEGFSREQLRLMAFGAENIALAAGRSLYFEGASADCAFVVAAGRIALYHEHDGQRATLAVMEPGSILGEFALITSGRRPTGAAAEVDSQVIRLNRSMFLRILEEYPDTAEALRQRIADNLQDMIDRMGRVASRLAEE